jgi:signal transduction histidine kinase
VHLLSGLTEGSTLKGALESILHESSDGTGIRIRSEIEDLVVSPAKGRFLCNTLREGISNGLRHGNATAFWFELKVVEGKIVFTLSDNGKGVEMDKWQEGFGLSSMRERACALGGEVQFHSDLEDGFEIFLTIPVDNEEE